MRPLVRLGSEWNFSKKERKKKNPVLALDVGGKDSQRDTCREFLSSLALVTRDLTKLDRENRAPGMSWELNVCNVLWTEQVIGS